VTGPWYLVNRYRWTLFWLGYIAYWIFVFRVARGAW
jgi:hypothetical protein